MKIYIYNKKALPQGDMKLTPDERMKMRTMLHSYMEMKPLRAASQAPLPAPVFGTIFEAVHRLSARSVAAAGVVFLVFSSVGISYAAEAALPGDLLYAIKVHVNEPIAGALAQSSTAKAAWATRVASERLREAVALSAKGSLSTTTQEELQKSFEIHSAVAIQGIEKDRNQDRVGSQKSTKDFEVQLAVTENELSKTLDGVTAASSTLQQTIHSVLERVTEINLRTQRDTRKPKKEEVQSVRHLYPTDRTRGNDDNAGRQHDESTGDAVSTTTVSASSSATVVASSSPTDATEHGSDSAEDSDSSSAGTPESVLHSIERWLPSKDSIPHLW